MRTVLRTKKILFFFNHKAEHEVGKILSGELPSDRLYGLIELRKLGWHVDLCDERITSFEMKFRKYFLWINFRTLVKAAKYEIWLVKDQFSLVLTLAAFLLRKRLIYIDCLFRIPRNPIRKFMLFVNTKLAPKIILYSNFQVDIWTSMFNLNKDKFFVVPYTIDPNFYIKGMQNVNDRGDDPTPYILATGRDVGRDFTTLINAARKANINVKLVTLPYLAPKVKYNDHLEILENISYTELFKLYYNASLIVVPLKKGIVYPSGIRAALEGMLVGRPVICSTTPILDEYAPKSSSALAYFTPEDEDELVECILRVIQDENYQKLLVNNAKVLVQQSFFMEKFTMALDELLILGN
jgi:glycosyltransferase involved in cell wall biosynthesis